MKDKSTIFYMVVVLVISLLPYVFRSIDAITETRHIVKDELIVRR